MKIKTIVDSITIEGEITFLSSSDLTVIITSPFQGLKSGLHIPIFARPAGLFKENGKITAKGMDRAERILKELYDEGKIFEENQVEIEAKIKELKVKFNSKLRNQGAITPNVQKVLKRALKKSLKDGEIGILEYEIALKKLIKNESDYDENCMEMRKILADWFVERFGRFLRVKKIEEMLEVE